MRKSVERASWNLLKSLFGRSPEVDNAILAVEPDFNRANQIQLCTSRSAPTPFFKSGSCK